MGSRFCGRLLTPIMAQPLVSERHDHVIGLGQIVHCLRHLLARLSSLTRSRCSTSVAKAVISSFSAIVVRMLFMLVIHSSLSHTLEHL